ncbi:hypothetical protein [Spiroplasma endosymbiont of Othius punctulatus]|uniref:hypothetical protein n=1 Tax=Spiroplasma endosymbiont of Othius punctulatus TaxID=3066289 RepID=UPI0030CAA067
MKAKKQKNIVGVIDGIEISKRHEFEEVEETVEKINTPYLKINTKKSTNINRIEINKINTQKKRKKRFIEKINVFALMIGIVIFITIVVFVSYILFVLII